MGLEMDGGVEVGGRGRGVDVGERVRVRMRGAGGRWRGMGETQFKVRPLETERRN